MKKNSLKTQITIRIFTIIGGMWALYFVVAYFESKSQYHNYVEKNNNFYVRNVEHTLRSKLSDLEVTTQLLSTIIYSSNHSQEISSSEIINNIDESWSNISKGSHFLQMIYYDYNHNYIKSWGIRSNSSQLLSESEVIVEQKAFENPDDVFQFTQGVSFFSCDKVCYINHAKTISPYSQSSNEGYLIVRYPIIAILDELHNMLPLLTSVLYEDSFANEAYAYYRGSKVVITDKSGPSTSNAIIHNSLGDDFFRNFGESIVDEQTISYFIHTPELDVNNYQNIKLLFFSDMTLEQRDLFFKKVYIFLFSTLTLVATTYLIYMSLRKPMMALGKIANVMPIIGDGGFTKANEKLKEISKNITSNEIFAINEITIRLTEDLEKAHAEIMKSLEFKSERYDFIQKLIDTSPAIFITYDVDNKILLCNKYTEDLLGLPREKIIGSDYTVLFKLEDEAAEQGGDLCSFNTFISDTTGSERMFSWMRTVFSSRINNYSQTICVGIDTSYRLKLENDIRFMAEHDALTGLLNRRKIDELVNQYIHELKPFYLLYIDVNYFKLVNDMLGHQAGDTLLIDLANMLVRKMGGRGIVGRTGGDEFTAVLFSDDRDETEQFCQELIISSNSIGSALGNDQALPAHVSLSIGLIAFPDNASTLEELYSKADAAMYENKIHRNGDYHFYSGNETLIKEMRTLKYWEDLIKGAIKNKMLIPYFQGIHDSTNSGKVCFYEVLCRIRHNDEILPAAFFIDKISNLPLLRELDEYILCSALEYGASLKEKPVFMINFSGLTISSLSNEFNLNDFIKKINYPLDRIVIEITEQSAIKDVDKTILLMKLFKKHGIRFALDDFGTGYSSLSYLRKMPFDFLKIDKSFMTESIKDNRSLGLVKSIIELVRGLDLKVIIEGVENTEIMELAYGLEADYLQGYHLSMPKPEIIMPPTKSEDYHVEFIPATRRVSI